LRKSGVAAIAAIDSISAFQFFGIRNKFFLVLTSPNK
jgi:hypothetical protein